MGLSTQKLKKNKKQRVDYEPPRPMASRLTSTTVSSLVTKTVLTETCKCYNGHEVLTNTETVIYLLSTA